MSNALQLVAGSIFANEWRVGAPVGRGGMGAVYVVEQLSTGKQRALKVMLPELGVDARLRQRFEQEARVGAKIESDHVVEVVGAGIDASTNVPWLAMELLKGETLAQKLAREGRLAPRDVREVASQLGHALAAAHEAGVVHRDLKPENLFLAHSRRDGVPFMLKVLDFGIAKVVAEAATRATAAIGTPIWMAPEQSEPGNAIRPATDVWAFGLIVYLLLTGRHYFKTANDPASSTMQILREILMEPIVPASQRANEARVGTLLPPGFDAWFGRCVERNVEARFPNAGDARTALQPLLSDVTPGPVPQQLLSTMPMTPTPTPRPVVQTVVQKTEIAPMVELSRTEIAPQRTEIASDNLAAVAAEIGVDSSSRRVRLKPLEEKPPEPTPRWLIAVTVIAALLLIFFVARDKLGKKEGAPAGAPSSSTTESAQ